MTNSNFHPDHVDPIAFLNCEDAFQITDNYVFSITNMTDRELREAIIHDILSITMWEKENNRKLHFGFTRLNRFLPRHLHKRVSLQMKHDEICNLIQIQRNDSGSEIRIKDNHAILQAAMDYSGVWYHGFNIPNDTNIFSVDHEQVEKLGGIDAITKLISSDILALDMNNKANAPTTNTVN